MTLDEKVVLDISINHGIDIYSFAAAIESRCREEWEKEQAAAPTIANSKSQYKRLVTQGAIDPTTVTVDAAPGSTSPGLPISGVFGVVGKGLWVGGVLSAATPFNTVADIYRRPKCDTEIKIPAAAPSIEQQARDLLERSGIDYAQNMTTGDLVEIANLISSKAAPSTDNAQRDEAVLEGMAEAAKICEELRSGDIGRSSGDVSQGDCAEIERRKG